MRDTAELESLMSDWSQQLSPLNDHLEEFLRKLSHMEHARLSEIAPEEFSTLLRDLSRAGALIAENHANLDRNKELLRYLTNLARLKTMLPRLDIELRLERALLDVQRQHLDSTTAWSEAYRQGSAHSR